MPIHDLYNGSEGVDNPTEHLLLPAVHPFSSYLTILTYIYEQDGLPGIGPATLAVNFACFIVSTIVAPQSADLSSTSFLLALDNHPQLRLRHLCGVCRLIPAEVPDILQRSGLAGCSAGCLWVSQAGTSTWPAKNRAVEEEGLDVWNIQLPLLLLQRVGRTHHHLRTRFLQLHHLLPHHLCLETIAALFCLFFVRDISQSDLKVPLPIR